MTVHSADARLKELGLTLPRPMQTANLPFELIRVDGNHAYLAGHVPLAADGSHLGSLDRVAGWLKLFGMVNAAPGFTNLPAVINGASELILDVFGPEAGAHARSAVGMAELPFSVPVEIEAELLLTGPSSS